MNLSFTQTKSVSGRPAGSAVGIRGLTKRFGKILAVSEVSLDVAPGEFVSLLGPSGCGKSTLLMMIAGFERPDGGDVAIAGASMKSVQPQHRNIGIVFQRYALFPHLNVAQNVAFPLRMRKHDRGAIAHQVDETLALVRLENLADRMPHQLSGGQSQRVALARAIIYRPAVLLMDEPLAALDRKLREEMQQEIKNLQRRLGITVIFVTHDQTEALTLSDRVAVLDRGRIVQTGSPRDLYDRPESRFIAGFVGDTNFLPGRLLRIDGRMGEVQLDSGARVQGRLAAGAMSAGQRVELSIRPEHLVPADDDRRWLVGQIDDLDFAGPTVTYKLSGNSGHPSIFRCAAHSPIAVSTLPGDRVALSWDAERATIFPLDGDAA